jgi:hypothetical protein
LCYIKRNRCRKASLAGSFLLKGRSPASTLKIINKNTMKKYLIVLALTFPLVIFAQTFDRDLYFGIQGNADVKQLQEFLTSQNVYSGPISGNFFSLTLAGVKQFQATQGIVPAAGYFGPLTRAKANGILSAQINASEQQALAETGATTTAPTTPKTTNDVADSLQSQINLLLQQVQLLQQQLQTQQQTQQTIQNLQTQVAQQTQTIQQIQQNTQQIQQNTTPPPAPATQSIIPGQNASIQSAQSQTQPSIPIYISSMDSSGNVNATTTDLTKAVDFPNCKLPDDWLNRMRAAGFNYSSVTIFEIATGVQCPSAVSHSAHVALAQFEQNVSAIMPYISFSIPAGALQPTMPRIVVLPLVASPNSALISPISISAGSANQKIGSYALTVSSVEGVYLTSITIAVGSSAASSFQNLKVVVGNSQFGLAQKVVASNGIYAFPGPSFTVPAGSTINIDVYADILLTANSMATATTLNGCVATGAVSYNAIGCTNKSIPQIIGQGIVVTGASSTTSTNSTTYTPQPPQSAGFPSLTISSDLSGTLRPTPQLHTNYVGVLIGEPFIISEISNAEDVKLIDMDVLDFVSSTDSVQPSITNLSLWCGGGYMCSGPLALTGTPSILQSPIGYVYHFYFSNPPIIPPPNGGGSGFFMKGEIPSASSGNVTINSQHTFSVIKITAIGVSSHNAASVTFLSPNTITQTIAE